MQQSQIKPRFICDKLKAEDADNFVITRKQDELNIVFNDIHEYFKLIINHAHSSVILKYDDGQDVTPMFIFAYKYSMPHVVDASLVIDTRAESIFRKYPIAIVKWGRERLKEIKANVILAHARADLPEALKFLETLGFSIVGLIEKGGPVGEDIILYKYIK